MYYHFAFMAVSIALFGMSLGALILHFFPSYFRGEKTEYHLAFSAFLFAVFMVISYLIHILFPVAFDGGMRQFVTLGLTYLLLTTPFIFSGICISLALTRFLCQIGKIYACDLAGAALGAVLTVFIIQFGGPLAILLSSFVVVCAAFLFGCGLSAHAIRKGALISVIVLMLLVGINSLFLLSTAYIL
jgi:hypothetical protein